MMSPSANSRAISVKNSFSLDCTWLALPWAVEQLPGLQQEEQLLCLSQRWGMWGTHAAPPGPPWLCSGGSSQPQEPLSCCSCGSQPGAPGSEQHPRLGGWRWEQSRHLSKYVCSGHLWLSWQPPELSPFSFYVSRLFFKHRISWRGHPACQALAAASPCLYLWPLSNISTDSIYFLMQQMKTNSVRIFL